MAPTILPVVVGVFMMLLHDSASWHEWAQRDDTQADENQLD